MSRTASAGGGALPFSIDKNLKTSLAEQVADGLRQCLRMGRYRAGDVLPSFKELARRLDVSQRVAREAIHMLVAEGRAMVRQRSGCRVLAHAEKARQGRILAVLHEPRTSYNSGTFLSELESRLVAAGYAVEVAYLPTKPNGDCDLSQLEDKMRSPFDLVFSRYAVRRVEKWLAKSGVPYVALDTPRRIPGAAAVLRSSSEDARRKFLERCSALGVKTAWVASYGASSSEATVRGLERLGVSVEWQRVPLCFGYGNLERIERAGYRAALRRFAGARKFPDLAVVMDDYFLRGVLTAFAELGVRIPDQLRLVAQVNDGFVPVTKVKMAVFRVDARRWAKAACEAIVQILSGKEPSTAPCSTVDFVDGPSLGDKNHAPQL